jgi:hypothetical protein
MELDVDAERPAERCCRHVNSRAELDLVVDRLSETLDTRLERRLECQQLEHRLDVELHFFRIAYLIVGFVGSSPGRRPVDLELDVDGTERGSRQLLPAPGVRMQLGMELDVDGRSRIRHG